MKYLLPASVVRSQLKYDLIGKDSQRGITLSYGWLANQCGHCMLGYIPTHLLYLLLANCFNLTGAGWIAALSISVAWLLFEIYNVVKPLRQQKKVGSLFEPDWKNIVHDTATDLGFFTFGALLAGLLLGSSWILGLVLVVLCVIIYPASKFWYHTKIFQQAAEYPFQFRLSQWKWEINEENCATVLSFLQQPKQGKHLLISGAYRSGKTSLAVAIANELSIQHRPCKYVTAMKLFSWMTESDLAKPEVPSNLWNWRKADCLVIDDINTGLEYSNELISPAVFLQHMYSGDFSKENIEAFKQTNTIWVLGDVSEMSTKALENSWEKMLMDIGIPTSQITQIHLSTSY